MGGCRPPQEQALLSKVNIKGDEREVRRGNWGSRRWGLGGLGAGQCRLRNDSAIELGGQEGDDDDETSSNPIDGWEDTPRASPESTSHKRLFEEFDDDSDGAEAVPGSNDDYLPPVANDKAEDDDAEIVERKVKAKTTKTRPRNSAKPATSKPAAPPSLAAAPKPTKKTKIVEFSDIAKNEEKTRQKELEVAQLRTRQQIKAIEVKGRFFGEEGGTAAA
ncbi:hypothetical protein B0H14DRAFT_3137175 [Mycena olivaceomarginata]|nr:hypothetical protein B0H14DRAFT_3137175 [Mycena olivaceomarginata]